jgi:hypothetical protein
MTWEDVTGFTGLLNDYPGAAAAYSLRLLDTTYTGSAIRVRRASDNAEQDIGFDNNELDTSALATFCSGTNGFVKTWYSQTGSNDATQTSTGSQPKIYDSSTGLVTENGKPAIDFTNDIMLFDSSISNTASTIVAIAELFNQPLLGDNGSRVFFDPFGSSIWFQQAGVKDEFTGHTDADQVLAFWYRDGTNPSNLYENGTQLTRSVSAISNQTGVHNGIGTVSGRPFSGSLQELLIYSSDQSSNRTGIETNINDFYSIYP